MLTIPGKYIAWSFTVAGEICMNAINHTPENEIENLDKMTIQVIERMGGWKALSSLTSDSIYGLFHEMRECYLSQVHVYLELETA